MRLIRVCQSAVKDQAIHLPCCASLAVAAFRFKTVADSCPRGCASIKAKPCQQHVADGRMPVAQAVSPVLDVKNASQDSFLAPRQIAVCSRLSQAMVT